MSLKIALDATYSFGNQLSGVGVYAHEILYGLAAAHPETRFQFFYRPHRFVRSLAERLPHNATRRLLLEHGPAAPDVFHGLNQRLPARRYRRAVSTFHDLFVLTGDYSTPEFRQRFADQARQAAARSDLIIAVSRYTAGQVEQLLGVERSRLRVIHHGVRFVSPATAARPVEKMILNVGAIQHRKNIGRLVSAFEQLPPDWTLVLAGSYGFGSKRILEQIAASPKRERIRVLGYVNDAALADLYRRAAIFAFPSLDEGFGIPVLEAMAMGIPVVSSNRSALPEICGDAALLVDPADTSALAAAFISLIEEKKLCGELSRLGMARAAKFSWTTAVDKTWAVYQELLA